MYKESSLVNRIKIMFGYEKELEGVTEVFIYIHDTSMDHLEEVVDEINNYSCENILLNDLNVGQFCVAGDSDNLAGLFSGLDSLGIVFSWELT